MDIEALRAKIKGIEEGKPKSRKWKPKDKHNVRLLPLESADDLATVIKWHYGVDNGRQMYCPSTHGDACPFCELAAGLKSWRTADGKEKSEADRKRDWEWFKKLDAATKHYAPMVERKEDGELLGPFLWEMTPKTYSALLKICVNDDWNEDHPEGGSLKVLTSLEHGLDLVVELKKAGEKGNTTNFDLTSVEERKKFSPLVKGDKAAAKALVGKIPSIGDIGKPITTEEAEKVFAAWKAGLDKEPAKGDGEGAEYTANAETVAKGGGDVDDAVSKLEKLLKG